MSEAGAAAVRAAVEAAPHAFSTEDFEPRGRPVSNETRFQKRSSVFVSGGDWASPSSRAILDALHDMSATEAANAEEAKAQLPFMRNAGSMMVDGEDADLFDAETVRAIRPQKKSNSHLVECKHCHRPVLATRFLVHLRVCPSFAQRSGARKDSRKHDEDVVALSKVDEEIDLVSAPYKSKLLADASVCVNKVSTDSTPGDTPVLDISLPYFSGTLDDVCALQKRGSQWQKRLTPLIPTRGARGRRMRRAPKIPLEPLSETPVPKKKQNTTEKRMLTAAASVGIGRTTANARDENDPFKFASGDWGIKARWPKLMKIVRPTLVPRAQFRRQLLPRETQLSLFRQSPDDPRQMQVAETESSKMVPLRVSTRIAKALPRPHPSLPGALLYVRGKYGKNLEHTSLGAMDISNSTIPKSPYMFHGQSYIAIPGAYISDTKAGSEITLPASVIDPAAMIRNQQRAAAAASAGQAQALQARRSPAAGIHVSPQPPPTKRQRTGKQQARGPALNHALPTAAGVPPKQPPAAQRKMQAQRQMANASMNQKMSNLKFQQQLAQRAAMPGAPQNVAINQAVAANVMNMKRAQGQPAQAKRQYRNPAASAIPPSAITAAALNASEMAASAASKGGVRGARGRQQPGIPVAANPHAHKIMHQAALSAYQQNAGMMGRGTAGIGARTVPTGMEAYQRGAGSRADLNYHHNDLAAAVARVSGTPHANARGAARAPAGARPQQRPDLRELERVQAQQLMAQLGAGAAQGRMQNIPRQSAPLMRPYSNPQARPGDAQRQTPTASAALGARQAGAMGGSAAQMFPGGQIPGGIAGLYNGGFPVQVSNAHDRALSKGLAQSMPMGAANPNLAFLQMIQGAPGAPLPNQISPTAPGMAGTAAARTGMQGMQDMRAMHGFAQGMGMQNNMMNYFPGAGDPANQNFAAIAAARVANTNPLGLLPNDAMMSQLLPTARPGAHPNMMHIPQANVPVSLGVGLLPPGNSATTTSANQALSEIDKALSLDLK